MDNPVLNSVCIKNQKSNQITQAGQSELRSAGSAASVVGTPGGGFTRGARQIADDSEHTCFEHALRMHHPPLHALHLTLIFGTLLFSSYYFELSLFISQVRQGIMHTVVVSRTPVASL